MEGVSVIFGIIWIIIVISIISKVAKGASDANRAQQIQQRAAANRVPPQRPGASGQGQNNAQVYDAQQERLDHMKRLDGKSSVSRTPASGYKPSSAYPSARYNSRPVDVKTSSVLLEDRRNDWLAQQLREEAAARRSGMLADLGAMHEVECAADDLKRSHVKRHNTTGINRKTFR